MPCHICEDAICNTPFVSQKLVFSAQLCGTWRPEGCCTTWEVHRWKAMGISRLQRDSLSQEITTFGKLASMKLWKQTTWAKDFSQHHVVHFITSVYPSTNGSEEYRLGLARNKCFISTCLKMSKHNHCYLLCKQSIQSQCIETIQVDSNQNDNYIQLYCSLAGCWMYLKCPPNLHGIWLLQHLSCPTPVGSSGTDCPGPSLKGNKKRQHIFHTFAVVARKYLFAMVGWNAPAFFR